MRLYVTDLLLGTSERGMKPMVSMPGLLLMPWARRPSLLATLFIQMIWYLSSLKRCQDVRESLVSSSITVPVNSPEKLAFIVECNLKNLSAWVAATNPLTGLCCGWWTLLAEMRPGFDVAVGYIVYVLP